MFKKSGHDAATEQKTYPVAKTDEEWREELSPEEYAVLRKAGTERAFTGEYTDTETTGVYRCKACQAELFESDTKFHSGCGWPSFYQPMTDTVEYIEDSTLRDEAGRGALRQLRLAPRPRLPRRLRHPHRGPLLHQLDLAHPGAEGLTCRGASGSPASRQARKPPITSVARRTPRRTSASAASDEV